LVGNAQKINPHDRLSPQFIGSVMQEECREGGTHLFFGELHREIIGPGKGDAKK